MVKNSQSLHRISGSESVVRYTAVSYHHNSSDICTFYYINIVVVVIDICSRVCLCMWKTWGDEVFYHLIHSVSQCLCALQIGKVYGCVQFSTIYSRHHLGICIDVTIDIIFHLIYFYCPTITIGEQSCKSKIRSRKKNIMKIWKTILSEWSTVKWKNYHQLSYKIQIKVLRRRRTLKIKI